MVNTFSLKQSQINEFPILNFKFDAKLIQITLRYILIGKTCSCIAILLILIIISNLTNTFHEIIL